MSGDMGDRGGKPPSRPKSSGPNRPDGDGHRSGPRTLDRGKLENAIRHHLFTHDEHNEDGATPSVDGTVHFRQFMSALLEPDGKYFDAIRDRLKSERVPLLVICETLIAPVSEELGRMWCSDSHSFGTVTAATARMQALLNSLSAPPGASIDMEERPRILLLRMPGNNHTLGLSVTAAVFQDEGWAVDGGASLELNADSLRMVREGGYRVIGLSVSALNKAHEVSGAIKRMRQACPDPGTPIMIGGASLARHRDTLEDCGADLIAVDVRQAIQMANTALGADKI